MRRRKITIETHKRVCVKRGALLKLVKNVLDWAHCQRSVNVIVGDDQMLQDLNQRYKKRQGTTDVLAFGFNEEDFLGEVYVSVDRASDQAENYGVSIDEELRRLVVHGLLHLLDFDHDKMEPLMRKFLQ